MDYSSLHALESNYSQCEEIDWKGMILGSDHFRCHISRSATCVFMVVGAGNPSDSQVGYSQIAFGVDDKILWFDVPMDDAILVEVVQTQKDAANKEFNDVLREFVISADLVAKITAGHQIHDEIEVFSVLESVYHIDQERMFQLCEELPLV